MDLRRRHTASNLTVTSPSLSLSPQRNGSVSSGDFHNHSINRRVMANGMYEWFSLLIIFSCLPYCRGGEQVAVHNVRESPIVVCSNVSSRPIMLHPGEVQPLPAAYGSSLFIWACELGNSECINSPNPTATMAAFNIGNDSNSYMLSAENGYNFPMRILSLSSTSCPAITCAGNLDDCPKELQILNSSGAVVACRPPDSGSAQLCSLYSSMVANSHCQTPGSSYDPSSISSTCPASIYLVARFIGN